MFHFKGGSRGIAPGDCFSFVSYLKGLREGLLIRFSFNKRSLLSRYCLKCTQGPTHVKVDFTFNVLIIHLRFVLGLVKCSHSFNRNTVLPPHSDWLELLGVRF